MRVRLRIRVRVRVKVRMRISKGVRGRHNREKRKIRRILAKLQCRTRLNRPVARFFFFFYGEVRSNNETDQTMPEAQVSGMGNCIASVSKNLVFLKL